MLAASQGVLRIVLRLSYMWLCLWVCQQGARAAALAPVRIHCGGPEALDSASVRWSADQFFSGGFPYVAPAPVGESPSPDFYRSERAGLFAYRVPLPVGRYSVALHFTEIYFKTPGKRIFKVNAEGAEVVPPLDIAGTVGAGRLCVKTFETEVTDGVLDLDFIPILENPKVSAIEIIQLREGTPLALKVELAKEFLAGPAPKELALAAEVSGAPSTGTSGVESWTGVWEQLSGPSLAYITKATEATSPVRLEVPGVYRFRFTANYKGTGVSAETTVRLFGESAGQSVVRIKAGGTAYTDSLGRLWGEDRFFTGGSVFGVSAAVRATADSALYQTERFGSFSYRIPLRNGLYYMRLHFAEIWFQTAGARIFDIAAEGAKMFSGLDMVSRAGYLSAFAMSAEVRLRDGVLDLDFLPGKDNPKVAAIEILPLEVEAPPLTLSVGPDLELQLPANSARLEAKVLLSGTSGPFTCAWSQKSGPAFALLATPQSAATDVQFPAQGTYRFRAEVSSGSLSSAAELSVFVRPEPVPELVIAPIPDVVTPLSPATASIAPVLNGLSATQRQALVCKWTQVSGPGQATIGSPASLNTSIGCSVMGDYVFRLTVSVAGVSAQTDCCVRAVGDISGQDTVRIRAGGVAFTDSKGRPWLADQYFTGGSVFGVVDTVKGTPDPDLYKSERFGTFGYHVPLRNGVYTVRLHFAELWYKIIGSRMFGVSAEGKIILKELDIFKNAGFLKALIWSGEVRVGDGVLDLEFIPWKEFPKVSGIEILPLALDPPPLKITAGADQQIQLPADSVTLEASFFSRPTSSGTASCTWSQIAGPDPAHIESPSGFVTGVHLHAAGAYRFRADVVLGSEASSAEVGVLVKAAPEPASVIRIRCGGGAYTDSLNRLWKADSFFTGGTTYSSNVAVNNVQDPALYQSERFGKQFFYKIPVSNGIYAVRLHFAETYWTQAAKRIFSATAEGSKFLPGADLFVLGGFAGAYIAEGNVTVSDGNLDLVFSTQADNAKISAIEIIPAADPNHSLHVDIRAPIYVVDYAGSGTAPLTLQGSPSHTHEFGQSLARFEWREGDQIISSEGDITLNASLGKHRYTLQIWDTKTPPGTLSDSVDVEVLPASAVRGVMASYFNVSAPTGGASLFKEVLNGFRLESTGSNIGSTSLGTASVVLQGDWQVSVAGKYTAKWPSGVVGSLLLDGSPWSGPVQLGAGVHKVAWNVKSVSAAALPIELSWAREDGASGLLLPVSHDESAMAPQINEMPAKGPAVGGELVEILGVGFFPQSAVAVLWGTQRLTAEILESAPDRIRLVTPPGSGTVSVRVQTPAGNSNAFVYQYDAGTMPIQFVTKTIFALPAPTQAAWGPDGRLYVADVGGNIDVLEVDDMYNVTRREVILGVRNSPNDNLLGIAFSPWEPPSAFNVYLGHAKLFITGGAVGVRPAPYIGAVSALASPTFQPKPLISGLPSSNHDHGINGITFDNRGQLYVSIGGNTNAGVPSAPLGGFDESPYSEAVLVASIRDSNFDGRVTYRDALSGAVSTDQNDGLQANVSSGVGLRTFATGFRNAFRIIWGTRGFVYGTDNGPNVGFGKASFTWNTEAYDPGAQDKVLLIGRGHYYGHANRNRGRVDTRENRYRNVWEVAPPELYTPPIAELPSSKNGIDEYRSTAFGGDLRGALLVQEWNGFLSAVKLTSDGRKADYVIKQVFGTQRGLDVLTGPGGAIVVPDYSGGGVYVSVPDDKAVTGMVAYDVFPWRAPASGNFNFVIGGKGFGSVADTSVRFGNLPATITSVTSRRIKGVIPANDNPTAAFLPVQVQSGGRVAAIPEGFRFLLNSGQGKGAWRSEADLPAALGECSSAELGGMIYTLGEGNACFLGFDTARGEWSSDYPVPPVPVFNPSLVVAGLELVLIGSAAEGAPWTVQIYDPVNRTWRQGAGAPWGGDAPAVAGAGRSLLVCGGLAAGKASTLAASYNVDQNLWTSLAPLPAGCAGAAAASDGKRIFVVGGVPGAATATVQVFDMGSKIWSIADASAGQGGRNRFNAAATFLAGELYVFGGCTESGEVLSSVEAWMASSGRWRSEVDLPEAAYGAGVVAGECEINVLGGRNLQGPVYSVKTLQR